MGKKERDGLLKARPAIPEVEVAMVAPPEPDLLEQEALLLGGDEAEVPYVGRLRSMLSVRSVLLAGSKVLLFVLAALLGVLCIMTLMSPAVRDAAVTDAEKAIKAAINQPIADQPEEPQRLGDRELEEPGEKGEEKKEALDL